MKRGSAILAPCLLAAALAALPARAQPSRARVVDRPGTAAPAFVTGLQEQARSGPPVATAAAHLRAHPDRYQVDDVEASLEPLEVVRGADTATVRFGQEVDGRPVFGAQYLVHMQRQAGGSEVESVNGHFFTELEPPSHPRLSTDAARALAIVRSRPARVERAVARGLTVLPAERGVLAYRFTLSGTRYGSPYRQEVFVNAVTGALALSYGGLQADGPVTHPGLTSHGQLVMLEAYERSGSPDSYEMRDRSRPMWGTSGGQITTHDVANLQFYDATGANIEKTTGSRFNDGAAVDAHRGAGLTYDFYFDLGRNSIDDQGMNIRSSVHYSEGAGPYCNAFWDGDQMVYGDCDPDETYPMSADLDVVGHELTHGVTQHTADLVYLNQSGAINEAISDYFGNAIDVEEENTPMTSPEAGQIGEDLCKEPDPADWQCPLRDMNDARTTASYLYYLADFDNGGVHDNSTIFSGALWDIRETLGDSADRYIYRALSEYMTPLDDFVDGRNAVVTAAQAEGATPADVAAIEAAFDAHGIAPGWNATSTNDARILVRNLAPFGFFPEGPDATAERFAVNNYRDKRDMCCRPSGVFVGRVDGTGRQMKVSGSPGGAVLNDEAPAISGRRVAWSRLSVGAGGGLGANVLGRRLGGRLSTLAEGPAQQWFPALDGNLLAWEDTRAGDTNIWARRLGRKPRRLTRRGGEQWMPQVSGKWVVWWDVGASTRAPRIGVMNFRSGRTWRISAPTRFAQVGPPAVGGGRVFWFEDRDGDGRGAIMKARLGTTRRRVVVPADRSYSPRWRGVAGLPLVDTNGESVVYSDERNYLSSVPSKVVGRDIWLTSVDGGRPRRVTSNHGDQAYPLAARGRRALWLDGSRARTDLMTRRVP